MAAPAAGLLARTFVRLAPNVAAKLAPRMTARVAAGVASRESTKAASQALARQAAKTAARQAPRTVARAIPGRTASPRTLRLERDAARRAASNRGVAIERGKMDARARRGQAARNLEQGTAKPPAASSGVAGPGGGLVSQIGAGATGVAIGSALGGLAGGGGEGAMAYGGASPVGERFPSDAEVSADAERAINATNARLALKLRRLECRTAIKLAKIDRDRQALVAFLSNPVSGTAVGGIAVAGALFAFGIGAEYMSGKGVGNAAAWSRTDLSPNAAGTGIPLGLPLGLTSLPAAPSIPGPVNFLSQVGAFGLRGVSHPLGFLGAGVEQAAGTSYLG